LPLDAERGPQAQGRKAVQTVEDRLLVQFDDALRPPGNDRPDQGVLIAEVAATPGTAGVGLATQGDTSRTVACIANFSAVPHVDYRVGLPHAGRWREILNTDAAVYGGSGAGNMGSIEAVPEPWHGRPASALITLPPMGVLWLAPEEADAAEG
jgi:hypothetical protein